MVLKQINISLKMAQDVEGRRRYASYLLAMVTYLRQILIAPIIVLAGVAVDVCKIRERNELSIIVKTEFEKDGLKEWLNSSASLYSSRMESILQKIYECQQKNIPRIIVFSAFRTSLRLLEALVKETYPSWKVFTLEAQQSMTKKNQILKEFGETENGLLLLTYKSGSEGLNLQHTNTVFLMDTLWNASSGEQAIARVARRGQKSLVVNVFTFISNTGIEKAMLEKHLKKINIAEELMNGPTKKGYHHMRIADIIKMVLKEDTSNLYYQIQQKNIN